MCIGVILCSRAYHRSLRNAWQPAFFSESLNGYANLMNAGADRLLRRLGKAAAKEQEVNIWRMLGDLTMDVVGTASFGCAMGFFINASSCYSLQPSILTGWPWAPVLDASGADLIK